MVAKASDVIVISNYCKYPNCIADVKHILFSVAYAQNLQLSWNSGVRNVCSQYIVTIITTSNKRGVASKMHTTIKVGNLTITSILVQFLINNTSLYQTS